MVSNIHNTSVIVKKSAFGFRIWWHGVGDVDNMFNTFSVSNM